MTMCIQLCDDVYSAVCVTMCIRLCDDVYSAVCDDVYSAV